MNSNLEVTTLPRSRTELLFHWFAIAILMLVGGFFAKLLTEGPPQARDGMLVGYWTSGAIGMTIGMAIIPMYVAAWTHFKRPWLVLMVWLPVAVLSFISINYAATETSVPASASATPARQPAFDTVAESKRFVADALAFESEHPALKYGNNEQILQLYLNHLGSSGLRNTAMLDAAYAAAVSDSRWQNGP